MSPQRNKPYFVIDLEAGGFHFSGKRASSIYQVGFFKKNAEEATSLSAAPVPGTFMSNWSRDNVYNKMAQASASEESLIRETIQRLKAEANQSTLIGWNIGYSPLDKAGYDLPALYQRAKKYGLGQELLTTLKNTEIRDVGFEIGYSISEELGQYKYLVKKGLIDETVFEQARGYYKAAQFTTPAGAPLGKRTAAEFVAREGKMFAGWKQESIYKLFFGKEYEAHQAAADVRAAGEIYEEYLARGEKVFRNEADVLAWAQEATFQKYKSSLLSRPSAKKLLFEEVMQRAARFGADFEERLIKEVTAEAAAAGTDFSAIQANKGINRLAGSYVPGKAGQTFAKNASIIEYLSKKGTVGKLIGEGISWAAAHPVHAGVIGTVGLLAATKPFQYFTGRDTEEEQYQVIPSRNRAYIPQEGLGHRGIASLARKENTDFGSPYEGPETSFGTILSNFNTGVMVATSAMTGYDRFGIKGAIGGGALGAGLFLASDLIKFDNKENSLLKTLWNGGIEAIKSSASASMVASSMMKGGFLSNLKLFKNNSLTEPYKQMLGATMMEEYLKVASKQTGYPIEILRGIVPKEVKAQIEQQSQLAMDTMGIYGLIGRSVSSIIEQKFPGNLGKYAGKSLESQMSSPTVIDAVMKYGSIKDVPGKEYITSNLKDIMLGAGVGAAISTPFATLTWAFNKITSNEPANERIDRKEHQGIAQIGRRQITDFGSPYEDSDTSFSITGAILAGGVGLSGALLLGNPKDRWINRPINQLDYINQFTSFNYQPGDIIYSRNAFYSDPYHAAIIGDDNFVYEVVPYKSGKSTAAVGRHKIEDYIRNEIAVHATEGTEFPLYGVSRVKDLTPEQRKAAGTFAREAFEDFTSGKIAPQYGLSANKGYNSINCLSFVSMAYHNSGREILDKPRFFGDYALPTNIALRNHEFLLKGPQKVQNVIGLQKVGIGAGIASFGSGLATGDLGLAAYGLGAFVLSNFYGGLSETTGFKIPSMAAAKLPAAIKRTLPDKLELLLSAATLSTSSYMIGSSLSETIEKTDKEKSDVTSTILTAASVMATGGMFYQGYSTLRSNMKFDMDSKKFLILADEPKGAALGHMTPAKAIQESLLKHGWEADVVPGLSDISHLRGRSYAGFIDAGYYPQWIHGLPGLSIQWDVINQGSIDAGMFRAYLSPWLGLNAPGMIFALTDPRQAQQFNKKLGSNKFYGLNDLPIRQSAIERIQKTQQQIAARTLSLPGLKSNRPFVTISGGGKGFGVPESLRVLLESGYLQENNKQAIVFAANLSAVNPERYKSLLSIAEKHKDFVTIFDFAPGSPGAMLPEYMTAAEVNIFATGASTTAEAVMTGKPFVGVYGGGIPDWAHFELQAGFARERYGVVAETSRIPELNKPIGESGDLLKKALKSVTLESNNAINAIEANMDLGGRVLDIIRTAGEKGQWVPSKFRPAWYNLILPLMASKGFKAAGAITGITTGLTLAYNLFNPSSSKDEQDVSGSSRFAAGLIGFTGITSSVALGVYAYRKYNAPNFSNVTFDPKSKNILLMHENFKAGAYGHTAAAQAIEESLTSRGWNVTRIADAINTPAEKFAGTYRAFIDAGYEVPWIDKLPGVSIMLDVIPQRDYKKGIFRHKYISGPDVQAPGIQYVMPNKEAASYFESTSNKKVYHSLDTFVVSPNKLSEIASMKQRVRDGVTNFPGLKANEKFVTISGGGTGVLVEEAMATLDATGWLDNTNKKAVIFAGKLRERDPAGFARIEALAKQKPNRYMIHEFAGEGLRLAEYMAGADVNIVAAGAATLTEAVAAGKPIVHKYINDRYLGNINFARTAFNASIRSVELNSNTGINALSEALNYSITEGAQKQAEQASENIFNIDIGKKIEDILVSFSKEDSVIRRTRLSKPSSQIYKRLATASGISFGIGLLGASLFFLNSYNEPSNERIEGMDHRGIAAQLRKGNTDFGSRSRVFQAAGKILNNVLNSSRKSIQKISSMGTGSASSMMEYLDKQMMQQAAAKVSFGDLPIGTQWRGYTLGEKLGEGGFGLVRSATRNGEDVAIKMLKSSSERHQRLFNREASFTEAFSGMVGFPKFIEKFDNFLIMEKFKGRELFELIPKPKQSPNSLTNTLIKKQKINISIQMAELTRKMHQSGIAHRDIKPSNMIFSPEGDLSFIDFGLAVTEREIPNLVKEGKLAGTRYYLPENPQKFDIGYPQDIYALAKSVEQTFLHTKAPRNIRRAIAGGLRIDPFERFTAEQFYETITRKSMFSRVYNKIHSSLSGFYNKIEGMSHKGISAIRRMLKTDHGSRYQGLFGASLDLLNWMGISGSKGLSIHKSDLSILLDNAIKSLTNSNRLGGFVSNVLTEAQNIRRGIASSRFENIAILAPQMFDSIKGIKGTISHERLHSFSREYGGESIFEKLAYKTIRPWLKNQGEYYRDRSIRLIFSSPDAWEHIPFRFRTKGVENLSSNEKIKILDVFAKKGKLGGLRLEEEWFANMVSSARELSDKEFRKYTGDKRIARFFKDRIFEHTYTNRLFTNTDLALQKIASLRQDITILSDRRLLKKEIYLPNIFERAFATITRENSIYNKILGHFTTSSRRNASMRAIRSKTTHTRAINGFSGSGGAGNTIPSDKEGTFAKLLKRLMTPFGSSLTAMLEGFGITLLPKALQKYSKGAARGISQEVTGLHFKTLAARQQFGKGIRQNIIQARTSGQLGREESVALFKQAREFSTALEKNTLGVASSEAYLELLAKKYNLATHEYALIHSWHELGHELTDRLGLKEMIGRSIGTEDIRPWATSSYKGKYQTLDLANRLSKEHVLDNVSASTATRYMNNNFQFAIDDVSEAFDLLFKTEGTKAEDIKNIFKEEWLMNLQQAYYVGGENLVTKEFGTDGAISALSMEMPRADVQVFSEQKRTMQAAKKMRNSLNKFKQSRQQVATMAQMSQNSTRAHRLTHRNQGGS